MPSPILFAGGEDINFAVIGGSMQSTVTNNNPGIDTTSGRFRSGYARYAITFALNNSSGGGQNVCWIRSQPAFAASTFWCSARLLGGGGSSSSSNHFFRWADVNGTVRLRIRANNLSSPGPVVIEKVSAAGTVTALVTSALNFSSVGSATPDKVDVYINYAVAGQITLYCNGTQICTYSGDVTTDGVTSLSYWDIGPLWASNGGGNTLTAWSEMIVSTRDTRNMSLVTQVASANGNADTFTAGTAANLAANTMSTGQASPNYSLSAGQIQQYTVTPALPAGSFGVVSVVHTALATIGTSGPTKFDFMVRTGGADFTSPDIAPTLAWAAYAYAWDVNPNTGNAWQTSELPNASASFNLGLKSVA